VSLGGSTITARRFIKNPKKLCKALCHLAVRSLPPGGSSSGTQKWLELDVPPSSYEQPARRFLEFFLESQKYNLK